jgi:general transcription factor 3C polypeptide 3 (transcription factor C subunit 4)
VVLDDENKVCDEVRLFFKGSSWATDAFRLKSAVIRALRCEVDVFSCGPEQKFYLRQIKAMDYALLDEENRDKFHFKDNNRVRYAAETQKGPAVPELSEHDPALLALYGHMLYVGGSPGTSLNYYYRAYVLKPDDPILNLCMGLAYVGMAFKRQAVNRQFHVQQGMMFFNKYCDVRRKGRIPIQLQEMEFNMGMLWNSIGLLHLAVPAYQKCIDLSPRLKKKRGKARKKKSAETAEEDFAPEAALALRTILAINGDMESAMALTRKWLVL